MSAIVKLTERGNAYGVTLPRLYLRELGWIPGDYLKLDRHNDELRIARFAPSDARPKLEKRPEEPTDA